MKEEKYRVNNYKVYIEILSQLYSGYFVLIPSPNTYRYIDKEVSKIRIGEPYRYRVAPYVIEDFNKVKEYIIYHILKARKYIIKEFDTNIFYLADLQPSSYKLESWGAIFEDIPIEYNNGNKGLLEFQVRAKINDKWLEQEDYNELLDYFRRE